MYKIWELSKKIKTNNYLKKKSDFVKIEKKSKNIKQIYNLEKSLIKDKNFEQKFSTEKLTLAGESRSIVDKPNTISITSFSEKKENKKVTDDDLEKQKENFFSEKKLLDVWNSIVLNYKELLSGTTSFKRCVNIIK